MWLRYAGTFSSPSSPPPTRERGWGVKIVSVLVNCEAIKKHGHDESQTRRVVCDHLPSTQRYWDKKSRSWKCGRCGKRCLTD